MSNSKKKKKTSISNIHIMGGELYCTIS